MGWDITWTWRAYSVPKLYVTKWEAELLCVCVTDVLVWLLPLLTNYGCLICCHSTCLHCSNGLCFRAPRGLAQFHSANCVCFHCAVFLLFHCVSRHVAMVTVVMVAMVTFFAIHSQRSVITWCVWGVEMCAGVGMCAGWSVKICVGVRVYVYSGTPL